VFSGYIFFKAVTRIYILKAFNMNPYFSAISTNRLKYPKTFNKWLIFITICAIIMSMLVGEHKTIYGGLKKLC
jgi:hypothetical protein